VSLNNLPTGERRGVLKRHVVSEGYVHIPPRMNAQATKPGRSRERGAEILEFALIFTALMMMMLGIVVFSRAYSVYQTMTRAAREGARMAALPASVYEQTQGDNQYIDNSVSYTTPNSAIFDQYIKPALQAASLNPALVFDYNEKVAWLDPSDPEPECGAIVSFAYPFHLNIPFTTADLTTINLHTQVQMRRENQPLPPSDGGTCP